jgi:hypothetical protein
METTALVIPHPQHSMPKIFLNKQIVPCPSSQFIGKKNNTNGIDNTPIVKTACNNCENDVLPTFAILTVEYTKFSSLHPKPVPAIVFYITSMAEMTQEQINKMMEYIASGMNPDEAAKKAEEEGADK